LSFIKISSISVSEFISTVPDIVAVPVISTLPVFVVFPVWFTAPFIVVLDSAVFVFTDKTMYIELKEDLLWSVKLTGSYGVAHALIPVDTLMDFDCLDQSEVAESVAEPVAE